MLKGEMERARKKIDETKKKTVDIRELKQRNDEKYQTRVKLHSIREEQNKPNKANMERRRKLNEDIKEKRYRMFVEKRREVDAYKNEKQKMYD